MSGDGQEDERRRRVRHDGAEDPSKTTTAAKGVGAEASRRSISSSRRGSAQPGGGGENAYPWLNAGAVGRPRSTGQHQQQRIRGRQWQTSSPSQAPPLDQKQQGGALRSRPRGRMLGESSAAGPVPRSSSQDMLSQAALVLTASATASPARGTKSLQSTPKHSPKHTRSWRRPLGGGSRGRRGGGGGGGGGTSSDDEEREVISFRDATLVAWLNSVLVFERTREERLERSKALGETSR